MTMIHIAEFLGAKVVGCQYPELKGILHGFIFWRAGSQYIA